MKRKLEKLVDEMLDGKIFLNEAMQEFEKVFIEKALKRNGNHISNTADTLGVHRNTVAKRIASYNGKMTPTAAQKPAPKKVRKKTAR